MSVLDTNFVATPIGTNSCLIASRFGGDLWDSNSFGAIASWNGGTQTNGFGWWLSTGNSGQDLYLNYGAGEHNDDFLVIPEPNVLLLQISIPATIYAARRRMLARQRGWAKGWWARSDLNREPAD